MLWPGPRLCQPPLAAGGNAGIGRRTGMVDSSGSTAWAYDPRGRVTREDKTITGAGTFTTRYAYDAMDRVISMTYPDGEVISTTYNAQGLPSQLRSATYALNYAGGLTYNALGQPTQMTLGNGTLTRWGYRGLGGAWDSPPSAGLANYGMLWRTRVTNATGAPLLDLRYAYDPVGNVTRITDVPRQANNWPTSGFTFQDAFNSKDTANWTWSSYQAVPFNDGGNNVVKNTGTGSSYDANFYRSAYSLASGQGLQLRFKVDQAETIAHFSIEANDATYRRFGVIANGGKLYVQYRDDGATWRYPADVLTNLQVNTWYVLRIVVDDGGRGFYVEAYQEANPAIRGSYNVIMPTGKQWRFRHWIYRGTAYIDDYREFSTTGLTWTPDERMGFTYDALDRLVGAGPVNGGTGYTAAYAYNPIGNITSKAENGAGWAYTYGDAAHKHAVTSLSNGWSYQYDANGNMISRTENGVTYQQTFDAENRLVRVTGNGQTAQFFYDGDGNRVKVTSGVTTTVYVGMLEVTVNGTQRITRTYYSLGAQMVAMRVVSSTGNTVYYLHGDHLGSVSLVTDHASRVVAQQRFLPYGGVRWQEGTFPTDVGFTGHRGHPALGLIFMRARYYHSGLGRFVSADTIVPEPGNPQSLNRFSYVLGNPLRYTDPTGHFSPEQLAEWFGKNWRDLFSVEWQTLLLEAELGDAAVYGLTSAGDPRFFVFAIQGEDLVGWNTDPGLYYLGPSPIQKLISQLHLRRVADTEVALFRSKFANPAGGASDWPEWDAFLSSIVQGTSSVSTM